MPFRFYEGWLSALEAQRPKSTPPSIDLMALHEFAMSENDQEVVVVAKTPEFKGTELQASIKKNTLNIKSERHDQMDGNEMQVSYTRKVTLPSSINVKEAKTTLQDGLVEVHIRRLPVIAHVQPSAAEHDEANGRATATSQKASTRKSPPAPRARAVTRRSRAKSTPPKKKSKRR